MMMMRVLRSVVSSLTTRGSPRSTPPIGWSRGCSANCGERVRAQIDPMLAFSCIFASFIVALRAIPQHRHYKRLQIINVVQGDTGGRGPGLG